MITYAKILRDLDSWSPEFWDTEFEFTGRIKYVNYPNGINKIYFEIKYIQYWTKQCSIWEIWKWFSSAIEEKEKIEFLPASKFGFDFSDEKIVTIVECD